MNLGRALALCLPGVFVAGCLLPSFETDQSLDPNSGGKGGAAGSTTTDDGGEAGTPSTGGAPASAGEGGGGGTAPNEVVTEDDEFVVVQEDELGENVLDNDEAGLTVTGFEDLESGLPEAYAATFDVAEDGTLTFEPAPGFFGTYRLRYDVENAAGDAGSATVTIRVQPVDVELAAVAENVGGFCLTGQAGDGVGSALSGAGDINGDGYDDLLIGAPQTDSAAGAVYVVLGSALPSSFELVALSGSDEDERYSMFVGEAGSELGAALAPLGDVLGDSTVDFMLGAPAGTTGDGEVLLIPGSATFQGAIAVGASDAVVFSGGASDNAGRLLAGGFDLTGDDAADPLVVVKLPPGNNGRYYVLDGSDLQGGALLDEAADFLDGSSTADNLTLAAASIGDADDDMENDLLLASSKAIAFVRGPVANFPDNLASGSFSAAEGLWFDRVSGPSELIAVTGAGDFDGDGTRDLAYCEGSEDCLVVFGPPSNLGTGLAITGLGGPAWISGGADLVSEFGAASDGASDLIVAQRDAAADADADAVYVLFGGSGQQAGSLSVSGLGDQGFTLTAPADSDVRALAPVGDVNGDGWHDFAVGDLGNDQVCVVLGGPYVR